jgi:hypothetical protein|tara:strand:+ start:885 stop:1172 length:288 start_codon:yes stop_codon:yes gene_type:complete
MGYYTYTEKPIGNFIEKDCGNNFEYSLNEEQDAYSLSLIENYPHKVWVGGERIGGDTGWRYANVKKTVAYVIVDEDEGGPILERWFLKKNDAYAI